MGVPRLWSSWPVGGSGELVLGVRVGRTVGLGGCVGAGRGGFPGENYDFENVC